MQSDNIDEALEAAKDVFCAMQTVTIEEMNRISSDIRKVESFLNQNNPYKMFTLAKNKHTLSWMSLCNKWRLYGGYAYDQETKPVIEWNMSHRRVFHSMLNEFIREFSQTLKNEE